MGTSNTTIKTERLLLRPITLDYKDNVFHELTPEITTYMYPRSPEKIEETVEFIKSAEAKNQKGAALEIVVLDKNDGAFLGCGGLSRIDTKTPEFGIWVKRSAHGNGYGKEAIFALKGWADKNLDYEYLIYPAAAENQPSRRIPEALGGVIAREYEETNMSGQKQHIVEYRIYPTNKKLN